MKAQKPDFGMSRPPQPPSPSKAETDAGRDVPEPDGAQIDERWVALDPVSAP